MKKKKLLIIIISVLLALVLAAVGIFWYLNAKAEKQREMVCNTFNITIPEDAEQIYFFDGESKHFCHAAYRVTEAQYNEIISVVKKTGYRDYTVKNAKHEDWIPYDQLLLAYRLTEGLTTTNTEVVRKYVYVTDVVNGCREIYLVHQLEDAALS